MNMLTSFVHAVNATARRSLDTMFPGYFPAAKHNYYKDFGWPVSISFDQLYDMYCRDSIAKAAVRKTARKCWETNPFLMEEEETHDETETEKAIRQRFDDLRVWQTLAEADRRSMVGKYAGVILRLADGRRFSEPVGPVRGGLMGLVEVIPAWEGQLEPASWDMDPMSETYGHPVMYRFNEAAVGSDKNTKPRSFQVHPDRVVIWSDDGTVHDQSLLESGFNDLMDMQKIRGAGGEGFWKNAKAAPVLQIDKDAKLEGMANAMGVAVTDLMDALNEQTENWQKGFDQLLMFQGMEAKTLGVQLPDNPDKYYGVCLQSFAASIEMPVKILVGMQTGERASQEDAQEWAQTCMGRRSNILVPAIMTFINRLERFGLLPERDWFLYWSDLTESSASEKADRGKAMSDVNQKNAVFGEEVFTTDEIREVFGLPPKDPELDDGPGDMIDDEEEDDDEEDDDADAGGQGDA